MKVYVTIQETTVSNDHFSLCSFSKRTCYEIPKIRNEPCT